MAGTGIFRSSHGTEEKKSKKITNLERNKIEGTPILKLAMVKREINCKKTSTNILSKKFVKKIFKIFHYKNSPKEFIKKNLSCSN